MTAPAPIVVAGLGSVGRRHLANLLALDAGPIRLLRSGHGEPFGDPHDSLPVDRDLDEALARGPRAIVVANPTAHHVEVSRAAARMGCHLLVEKPLSHSLAGVGELAREVAERGTACLIGFQFRFHPALRWLRACLQEGAIGRIISAQAEWGEFLPGWHPHEDYRRNYAARRDLGGGVVLTLCHPFDTLRWLLGEVTAVSAEAGRLSHLEMDVEDVAQVTLRFASGAIGSVALDYVQRPRRQTLRVVGQDGSLSWDGASQEARLLRFDDSDRVFAPERSFERNTMFVDEMRHFLECVDGRQAPSCTLQDGIRALRIALAALSSAQTGRRIDV